ncbi:penicillin-binding protein 2 [Corynebacterium poyangense]|uniref:Penicillin-binding protein 2 n=1 Tax=Corynebacterium poyangense TaxID=2684405 RepID=A0A7H0SKZ6_9CORY|nr:penicillin-binding protein 2 [Corynebacterium poyangense]MBZ8177305.1 penicillin-binding protein 2 [Corynebacterium poyangense]QNQ89221.1 penicillin-binding protein 2 [Corynebacterium poyangense]
MNRSIRHLTLFCLLLTLVLVANLTLIHGFRHEEYANNPKNPRIRIETQSIARGTITAGGQVLAESHPDENGIYHRSYPTDPVAFSPITGYLSNIYGTSGLENSQNDILNGTDDSLITNRWREMFLGKDQVGANVETSIIPEVQETAYNALARSGYQGAVVAIKPSTGEILAMASSPSFDANGLSNDDTAESTWNTLSNDSTNPLLNHATQETLPPGSTFKIITTAAGLQHGYSPDSKLTGAPSITLPGTEQTLTNYDAQPCAGGGEVTLRTAFALSCNTAFVQMGIGTGVDALRETAQAFGVGQSYDLGIPTAAGALGDIPDQASLGQSSIGQRDVSMSALQAAVMAATVANNGKRMEPHLISRITGADLHEISRTKPKELNQAIPEDIAAQIRDLMIGSERSTHGYAGEDIASKTGTAEHGGPGDPPHTWYVAFGPSQNADVAVAVVVKNGGGMGLGATGGAVSSPIGREVLNTALRYLKQ